MSRQNRSLPPTPSAAAGPVQARQGDVLLVPVDGGLPRHARRVPRVRGRLVLAAGEVTGHAHVIRSGSAMLVAIRDERWLRVTAPVTLDHEEHAPVAVEPGTYRVVIQREYVPPEVSAVMSRRVVD